MKIRLVFMDASFHQGEVANFEGTVPPSRIRFNRETFRYQYHRGGVEVYLEERPAYNIDFQFLPERD